MKMMIDETDFTESGLPKGAFAAFVRACVVELADPMQVTPTVEAFNVGAPPVEHPDCSVVEDVPPPIEATAETAAPTTPPPPKKNKRRSKAQIAADDDNACRAEIKAAAAENREPDPMNLPNDTRKRVGRNPKSWIDPQEYAAIMAAPCPAPDTPPAPEVDPTPLDNTDASPPTDFSAFLPEDAKTESQLRFEIGDKLNRLAQLDRPAVQKIIAGWKTGYNTTSVTEIPADQLPEIVAELEKKLDGDIPDEVA